MTPSAILPLSAGAAPVVAVAAGRSATAEAAARPPPPIGFMATVSPRSRSAFSSAATSLGGAFFCSAPPKALSADSALLWRLAPRSE